LRDEPYRANLSWGRGNLSLPADLGDFVGPGRVEPDDIGADVQRHRGHRQHATLGAQKPGYHIQAGYRIAEALPQPDNEQVPDCVII
jgi:hypothetical protein